MENAVSFLTQTLELLYFISGIALAIFGFYGLQQIKLMKENITTELQQIKLMKEDIITRNDRQAIEKSIDYLDRFTTRVVPLIDEYFKKLEENNLKYYDGPVYDFIKISIKGNKDKGLEALNKKMELNPLNLLNEFEIIGAAMFSGLANEKIAFNPLGRTFCQLVEKLYDVIVISRDKEEYYSNLVALYKLWKPRVDKIDLMNKKEKIDSDLASIKERFIRPIGTSEL